MLFPKLTARICPGLNDLGKEGGGGGSSGSGEGNKEGFERENSTRRVRNRPRVYP